MSYIAFIAGLPDITFSDNKLSLSIDAFKQQLSDYITEVDKKDMDIFFLPNDNVQLLRILRKQEPDMNLTTVFPLSALENAVQNDDDSLLPYMNDFIRDYKNETLRYNVMPENVLAWMYYDYMLSLKNSFVKEYAEFSMNIRNFAAALNARKYGMNVENHVVGSNDFAIAVRTSNARDFGLSLDYKYVEQLMTLFAMDDFVEREKGIDLLLWEFLEEAVTFEYFSLKRVIAFMLRLMIVERWSKLDSESGHKVFMELVDKLKASTKA